MNEFELHTDRLATSDENGKRLFLHPADVRGFFRRQRTKVQIVLIAFFLILPWIRIQGKQALLLDIAQRRFEIFGLSLRAHNAPLLFLVLAIAAFGLFFVTAVFGRVWCGWACPQTVFIDGVYRRIERWIEGPAYQRHQLDKAPWDANKIIRRTAKWFLYVAVTFVVTHSFLAYFVGTDHLSAMMIRPPSENWGSFLFMFISGGIILFDFAWFREQFCVLVCPYGRLQSVLMDRHSLVVSYDKTRGEPRATPQAKLIAKTHNSQLGDCVNCYRCVQVCPTGIDIRRGVQMECTACTSCIDACDEVMTKLKKPTGLIKYDTLISKEKTDKRLPIRAGIYLLICVFSVISLAAFVYLMKPIDVEIFRAKDIPYSVQQSVDGSQQITNHFKFELSNQSGEDRQLFFKLSDESAVAGIQLISVVQPLLLNDGKMIHFDVFIQFPKSILVHGEKKLKVFIQSEAVNKSQSIELEKETTLVGPF